MPDAKIVPIVLHGIVRDGMRKNFEDVEQSTLRQMLSHCRGRFLDSATFASNAIDGGVGRWLFTFDDGLASDYEIALPLLVDAGCKPVCFVISDRIGTPGFVTSPQLREMAAHGILIGSHSASHPDLTTLSDTEVKNELDGSKKRIEDILGEEVACFSFPFGQVDSRSVDYAFSVGYQHVFTSRHGIASRDAKVFPRNSLHGGMPIGAVLRALDARLPKRWAWWIEDRLKAMLIDTVGKEQYLKIRGMVAD